jgi:hypothetical protein
VRQHTWDVLNDRGKYVPHQSLYFVVMIVLERMGVFVRANASNHMTIGWFPQGFRLRRK